VIRCSRRFGRIAFAISVLCPYDATSLGSDVLADAERTHPYLTRRSETVASPAYRGPVIPDGCNQPLTAPPASAHSLEFRAEDLREVRSLVAEVAQETGLERDRLEDLKLVSSELATNTVRHARGEGIMQVWEERGNIFCQVRDAGHITDPLAGPRRPAPLATGGLGLWMVNQLCDLVEVRSSEQGTTVRARVSVG
jgi:anti-sigma regulatory factor (Ser/Thr protein kinase)